MKTEEQAQSKSLTGWTETRIGDICYLVNGRAFKPTEWASSGVPIIRIQNLNDSKTKFNYCDFEVEEKYIVNNGQLLFAWSGTPGTSFGAHIWNRGKAVLNQHIFKVNINESLLDKTFLKHLMNKNVQEYVGKAHGTAGLAHITKAKFEESQILLPPFNEQHRISSKVEVLFSFLDAGVESLRKVQAQLKRYRQAFLKYAFEGKLTAEWRKNHKEETELTFLEKSVPVISSFLELPKEWKWVNLKTAGELISGQHILSENYNFLGEGVPYLTGPADFGEANPLITKWTTRPKVLAKSGDVLITVKGAGVGKANILNIEKVAISRQLMAVRSQAFEPNFLFRYAQFIFSNIQKLSQGSTVPGIRRKELLDLPIPLCSLGEQKKIVHEIENGLVVILESKKAVDIGLRSSERLRKSILKKAFEGGLVLQDENDESAELLLKRIKADKMKGKTDDLVGINNELERIEQKEF